MFYLKSNDSLLLNTIVNVLNQKVSLFNSNNEINSFATISISSNENTLFIETTNGKKSISKPLVFTKLFEEIENVLSKIKISFIDLDYIPAKQNLIHKNKSLVLGNIHNLLY